MLTTQANPQTATFNFADEKDLYAAIPFIGICRRRRPLAPALGRLRGAAAAALYRQKRRRIKVDWRRPEMPNLPQKARSAATLHLALGPRLAFDGPLEPRAAFRRAGQARCEACEDTKFASCEGCGLPRAWTAVVRPISI
jgi:hypothetical protein